MKFLLRPVAALSLLAVLAPPPALAGPVTDRIRQSGRLVIAHRESSVPLSYVDADKRPVGYAVELCQRVAEAVRRRLGLDTLQVAYLQVDGASRIPAIVEGKADPEFKKIVDDEMKRLITSREAHAIYERWFMKPIAPKGVTLNLPMNHLTRDFWKYPTDVVPN